MSAHVRAVSPQRFEAWLADRQRDIARADQARSEP
jgi:heme/copper-type cytochrome/quinol oxidase subunit 2